MAKREIDAFILWRIRETFEAAVGASDPSGLRALLLDDLNVLDHAPEDVSQGKHIFHATPREAQIEAIKRVWKAWNAR